ncbi:hypothetical protein [Alkalicoccobacillus murimartini]|uniref:Uncharacterized protein n=1 Tax=Alkalicoccobacillus murimartini TaxID=171685 RepID=A0ABT9YN23_9BACI|nr:hypothetical protein [Alkalicoccobacillus murimartini]MDQ0208891.1 hypothetical protein [Alkalicoccobacillus murimartini]
MKSSLIITLKSGKEISYTSDPKSILVSSSWIKASLSKGADSISLNEDRIYILTSEIAAIVIENEY